MVYHEPQFTEVHDLSCHDAARRKAALDTAIGNLDFGETPDMSGIEIGPHFDISCNEEQKAAILACAAELPLMLQQTGWRDEIKNNVYYTSLLGQQVSAWPKREGISIDDPVQLSPNSWRVIWSGKIGKHVDFARYGLANADREELVQKRKKHALKLYGPRTLDNPLLRENVQDAVFVPYNANEGQALAFIRKQAQHMSKALGHDEDLLYYSMAYTLRKNLEALDHSRVIRFSPKTLTAAEVRGKEVDPNERVLFSPHEVRNTFRAVREELAAGQIGSEEEASIEFLRRLNAMPEGEGYIDIRREIKSAHGFLKQVIATADEVTRKYFVERMGAHGAVRKRKKIDIKNALRNKSLYELLTMMYDNEERSKYDSRTLSEAETMLGIFSLFWRTHYHELKKNHEEVENDLNDGLEEMADKTEPPVEVAIPELIYDKARGRFYKEHDMTLDCYPVQAKYLEGLDIDGDPVAANMVPMVYIDEAQGKSEEAITNKLSGKSPEARLEDLTDIKRARILVANWTSIQVAHDPRKQKILIRVLQDIARRVGLGEAVVESELMSPLTLKYRKQSDQDGAVKSKPRSRIEIQLDENFPKIKLIGYNEDGVCVEVQAIFNDTYAFDQATDSPISHKNIQRDRRLVQIQKQLSESEYGAELHTAVGMELEASKEERTRANAARLRYLAQMSALHRTQGEA